MKLNIQGEKTTKSYSVSADLPSVIVAFWDATTKKFPAPSPSSSDLGKEAKSHFWQKQKDFEATLSLDTAKKIIQSHKGKSSFALQKEKNEKGVSRRLAMTISGKWAGDAFTCERVIIYNKRYTSKKSNLRAKETAEQVADSLPKE